MKTSRKKSSVVNVARWISYAAAGAVTAVGAANDSDGAILFSGVLNTPVPHDLGGKVSVVLHTLIANSHPGTKSFAKLIHASRTTAFSHRPYLYLAEFRGLHPVKGAVIGVKNGSYFYASKLAAGANISGGHFLSTNKFNKFAQWGSKDHTYAGSFKWAAGGTGFIGFEFNSGAGEQYGWAEVTLGGPKNYYETLVDYAYGTVGQAITAGETGLAVPEPASLGLLAFGAAGLLAMRGGRRQKMQAVIV